MSEFPLVSLAGIAKDYPKVATGGDRLRTLASLMLRSGDFPHFRALEDINLEVHRGENGAQRGVMPEVGCAQATMGRPPTGGSPCGTTTTPETKIGSPFIPVER